MNPFPSSSIPLPAISPGLIQMLAARSGWLRSTPVSITAIATLRDPVVISHASSIEGSAPTTPAPLPGTF